MVSSKFVDADWVPLSKDGSEAEGWIYFIVRRELSSLNLNPKTAKHVGERLYVDEEVISTGKCRLKYLFWNLRDDYRGNSRQMGNWLVRGEMFDSTGSLIIFRGDVVYDVESLSLRRLHLAYINDYIN